MGLIVDIVHDSIPKIAYRTAKGELMAMMIAIVFWGFGFLRRGIS